MLRPEVVKLLKENTEGKLLDIGLGNYLSVYDSKAKAIK